MIKIKRTAIRSALAAACAVAIVSIASAADNPKIGVDLTTLTSPFWTSYNQYIVAKRRLRASTCCSPSIRNSIRRSRSPVSRTRSRSAPRASSSLRSTARRRARFSRPRQPPTSRSSPSTSRPRPARSPSSSAPTTSPTAKRPANTSANTWRKARSCRSWATRPRSTAATAASASATASRRTIRSSSCSKFRPRRGPARTRRRASTRSSTRPPISRRSTCTRAACSSRPTLQTLKRKRHAAFGRRAWPYRHCQQRRNPAGIRRDPQGRDRRHRLAACRPLCQVRHHVFEGGDRGKDVQDRPDRPRQQHRRSGAGRARRSASRRRWSQRKTSTTRRSGGTISK